MIYGYWGLGGIGFDDFHRNGGIMIALLYILSYTAAGFEIHYPDMILSFRLELLLQRFFVQRF